MKKYNINDDRCDKCGGLISWDDYPNPTWPIHVDKYGHIIGDGSCPEYNNSNTLGYNHFVKEKFKRFEDCKKPDIFNSNNPHLTRFLIGEAKNKIDVRVILIKFSKTMDVNDIYRSSTKLIGRLFEEYEIVAFYKLNPTCFEENEENYVKIFLINRPSKKIEELEATFNDLLDEKIQIVNTSRETIVTKDYAQYLAKFFNSLMYKLRFKFDNKKFEASTSVFYDILGNKVLFYVDLDAKYSSEKNTPVSKSDEGKRVLGEGTDGKPRKYTLRKITSTPVNKHLDSNEYKENFIPFIQNKFFEAGKSKKKENEENWTVYEFWTELNNIDLDKNDNIAIVTSGTEFRAKKLFFPQSKLFNSIPYIPELLERANDIQEVKKKLHNILLEKKEKVEHLTSSLKVIPLEEVVPKYFDLMKFPFEIEFKDKNFKLKRDNRDFYQLNYIPQELLKNNHRTKAGKFEFCILSLLPNNLTENEEEYFKDFEKQVKKQMKNYNLANAVNIQDPIYYSFNPQEIKRNKRNIWAANFNKEIAPRLKEFNEKIKETDKLVILLLGLKDLQTASLIFKREMQNYFYDLLKSDLSSKNFNVIQGIKYDKKKVSYKAKKATMYYRNCLINVAANNPDSLVAKRLKKGLIFTKKRPFGTINKDDKIGKSVDMIAGFDASKAEHAEFSDPKGATITMIDPYGRQIKTDYIENALTHNGIISEKAVRSVIEDAVKIQDTILNESYKDQEDKLDRNKLDYYIYKNPNIERKIIFIYDGKLYNTQVNSFITIYQELKEEYANMPEIYLFEILKSHPIRNYLYRVGKVENIPFGTLAILNQREILLKSHILRKDLMANPRLYRFKMHLTNKNGGDNVIYDIPESQLLKVGIKLFQTALFNTGKSGRPLKETKVIHESHKLSKEFAEKPDSIGILHYKD